MQKIKKHLMSRYRGKLRTDGRTANGKFIGNSVLQYYLQIRLLIKMKNKFYTLSNAFNVKHLHNNTVSTELGNKQTTTKCE